MTVKVTEAAVQSDSTHQAEMLIEEARQLQQRHRRRRWAVIVAVALIIAAALVVAAGGGRNPTHSLTVNSSRHRRSSGTTTYNAAAGIPGGQHVESVQQVGGQTSWVFTLNVVAQSNGGQGIEWTNDGGRTWRDATPNGYNRFEGDRSIASLFALTPTRAWIVVAPVEPKRSTSETVLTTENAGRSWSRLGSLPLLDCSLEFLSARFGVCTSAPGASDAAPLKLAVTSDGGRTWTTTFDNVAGFANGPPGAGDNGLPYECDKTFTLTAPSTVWAEGWCNATNAFLYRSTDSGRHWTLVSTVQPSPIVEGGAEFTGPVVLSGRNGAVAFEEGHFSLVYVSHNGGTSFTPVYPPGPKRPWTIDIVSAKVWRLTFRNHILGTDDGGRSWFNLPSNAFASPAIQRAQRWGTGAPDSMAFTSSSFGWMTWFDGNGEDLMVTRNNGQTWKRVAVPGTEKQRD
jgi:photosystem II stability/assembly factor-like uncharacterized protein